MDEEIIDQYTLKYIVENSSQPLMIGKKYCAAFTLSGDYIKLSEIIDAFLRTNEKTYYYLRPDCATIENGNDYKLTLVKPHKDNDGNYIRDTMYLRWINPHHMSKGGYSDGESPEHKKGKIIAKKLFEISMRASSCIILNGLANIEDIDSGEWHTYKLGENARYVETETFLKHTDQVTYPISVKPDLTLKDIFGKPVLVCEIVRDHSLEKKTQEFYRTMGLDVLLFVISNKQKYNMIKLNEIDNDLSSELKSYPDTMKAMNAEIRVFSPEKIEQLKDVDMQHSEEKKQRRIIRKQKDKEYERKNKIEHLDEEEVRKRLNEISVSCDAVISTKIENTEILSHNEVTDDYESLFQSVADLLIQQQIEKEREQLFLQAEREKHEAPSRKRKETNRIKKLKNNALAESYIEPLDDFL